MPPFDADKLNFKAGDPIRAADLMTLVEAVRNPGFRVRGGNNVHVRRGSSGDIQVAGSSRDFYWGYASSLITARSTSTPGTGHAVMRRFGGSILGDGATIPVRNFGVGIADGQDCRLEEDADGVWWATGFFQPGWCQLASSLGPATGTWPSISATTQGGVTVYVEAATGLASTGTATVVNRRNVTWATGKTTLVLPRSDGTWSIVDQDC